MKYLLMSLLVLFHLNAFALGNEAIGIEFEVLGITHENNNKYIIISMKDSNKHHLDSLVKENAIQFQYHGTEFITMYCNSVAISPISCLFEDNMGGILPYYKFVVGFENVDGCDVKRIEIEIGGITYKIES